MATALASPPSLAAPADRLVTLPSGVPDLTLGWEAVRWASKFIRQPNGPRAGERFEFVDSQIRFLLWWYALDEDGEWLFHHGVRRLAKGSGKALELGVPLPTPTGWTTMGDVQVGDQLLDEFGNPCNVVAMTPVMTDRECYRVSFRDGTSVVADADHLWPLLEFVGGHKRVERTVTTREIAAAGVTYSRKLTSGKTKASSSGVARWKTLPTPSLDLPEIATPLPPYLLGYWLGDGDRDAPRVTVSVGDFPAFAAKADSLGVHLGTPKVTGNPGGTTYRVTFLSATGQGGNTATRQALAVGRNALKELGVWRDKHIPAGMLRGSRKQRLELLRGLMDSDGSVDAKGRIELSLCNQRLAEDAVELMRTLGLYPRMKESDATIQGRVVGRRWRINVTAYADEPIFTLPRKVARLRPRGKSIPYSQVRTVTAVEPIPSVPVKCVTVDSPNSLYLAGPGMVPTHNSPFAGLMALIELCAPVRLRDFDPDLPGGCKGRAVDMPLVQIAATAESQTANTMRMVRAFAPKTSRVVAEHGLDPGKTQYYKAPEGTLEVITASSNAAEGAEATFVVADETEHWKPSNGGPELASTLEDNLTKSGNRMLETCNAWEPGVGSVAESSWDGWVAQEEGRTRGNSRILYDARVAPPDTDMSDEESLTRALRHVYDDCWWVRPRPIIERIWDPRSAPDASKRKYLNWPTVATDAWMTPQQWALLADSTRVVADREDIVMFFDGSKSRDATALVGCCVSDGHVFTIGAWEPGSGHDTTSVVPVSEVDAAVEWAFDAWNVRAFFADVKEWEGFAKVTWPERYRDRLELHAAPSGKEPQAIAWDMRTKTYDFTMAVELTETEIREQKFTHSGDARMARHVGNCRRKPNRWGVSVGKESPDSPRKIDIAVAMIGARMLRGLLLANAAKSNNRKRSGKVW